MGARSLSNGLDGLRMANVIIGRQRIGSKEICRLDYFAAQKVVEGEVCPASD